MPFMTDAIAVLSDDLDAIWTLAMVVN